MWAMNVGILKCPQGLGDLVSHFEYHYINGLVQDYTNSSAFISIGVTAVLH